MKILFIGDLRSPFIKQDLTLLREIGHWAHPFNLGEHARSFWQVLSYPFHAIGEINRVRQAGCLWIWYADYPAIPFILLAKHFNVPVVINLGGYEVYNAPEIGYGNQTKLIRGAASRWVLRNVWGVITQSDAYRKIVEELVPDTIAYIFVIPPYIDTSLCEGPMPVKKDLVVTASCSEKNDVLKGIPTFLKMKDYIPEYQFKVLRHLPREEYIQALREAKVYCQLSYTEQFGVSVAEAMACGCIQVVSDKDGLPETIGDAGLVVPFGAVQTSTRIRLAATMDGTKARQRARMFSRANKAMKLEKVFERLRQCQT